jgi:IMP dehydrogenase
VVLVPREFRELLTFDDVVLVPGLATVEPSEVDLTSKFTSDIEIYIPLVSSPMDTVTEWGLATTLARLGSIGVIHRNMGVESQVSQVKLVKRSNPSPWAEVARASPRESFEDVAFRVEELQVGAAIIFSEGSPVSFTVFDQANPEFWARKALGFIRLLREYKPVPVLDEDGRLRVGAAISPFDIARAKALDEAGVDALVIDVAHAHNVNVISGVARIAKEVSADIVVGNLGTRESVLDFISKVERVSGLRVGIASGSICSTAEVTGAFMPTLTAVIEARSALEELGLHGRIPIIADGGFKNAGDIAKALVAGASVAMSGRLFAGVEEAPGVKIRVGSKVYKQYRGMGSRGAMERRFALDRYSRPSKGVEEGVEGLVPYRGSVVEVLAEVVAGLKASLGYAGARDVENAWKARLARVTHAGREEARPHDVMI